MRELLEYDWPGNVRQLEQLIQAGVAKNREILFSWDFHPVEAGFSRAPSRTGGDQLGPSRPQAETAATAATRPADVKRPTTAELPKSMDEVEKEKIKEALEVTQGNATRAAELLGYKSRQTILNKMDRYGIPRNYADPQSTQPSA